MSEIHGWTHAPNGADAIEAAYEIKVYPDENSPAAENDPEIAEVTVGDGKFIWAVPRDVAGSYLREAEAFETDGGAVTVQIRRIRGITNTDLLTTKITIQTGEFTSYTASIPSEIDVDNSQVLLGDLLAIDVDAISGVPKGLGVILNFGPRLSITP